MPFFLGQSLLLSTTVLNDLTQLRWNTRSRADKTSGHKRPRIKDCDVLAAPDSLLSCLNPEQSETSDQQQYETSDQLQYMSNQQQYDTSDQQQYDMSDQQQYDTSDQQ